MNVRTCYQNILEEAVASNLSVWSVSGSRAVSITRWRMRRILIQKTRLLSSSQFLLIFEPTYNLSSFRILESTIYHLLRSETIYSAIFTLQLVNRWSKIIVLRISHYVRSELLWSFSKKYFSTWNVHIGTVADRIQIMHSFKKAPQAVGVDETDIWSCILRALYKQKMDHQWMGITGQMANLNYAALTYTLVQTSCMVPFDFVPPNVSPFFLIAVFLPSSIHKIL